MAPADRAPALQLELAYSPQAGRVQRVSLRLPAGATVRDALQASGLFAQLPALVPDGCTVGVWGKSRGLDEALRDGDRVEVYRALLVDPKEARRQRYRSQRVKTAP